MISLLTVPLTLRADFVTNCYVTKGTRMGRKPIGQVALTNAERQERHRQRMRARPATVQDAAEIIATLDNTGIAELVRLLTPLHANRLAFELGKRASKQPRPTPPMPAPIAPPAPIQTNDPLAIPPWLTPPSPSVDELKRTLPPMPPPKTKTTG
jgi:hypothetical protein